MKTLLVFTLIAFASFSQVPNYIPTDQLSVWYPFSNNANDFSVNSLNAANNGATLTTDRFSNSNSAFSFDGTGSTYIQRSNPTNELLDGGIGSFSVSVWFKTQTAGFQSILHKRRMGGTSGLTNFEGYDIYLSNGTPIVTIEDVNGLFSDYNGTGNYADNQWHNIIVVRDASLGEIQVYLDGELDGVVNDITTSSISTTTDFYAGLWVNYPSYSFNGSIDDIAFWKRSLDFCEIGDVYNASLGSMNTISTLNINALDSYTLNSQTYTQSGTYTQVVPNANGCDSTITLNLNLDYSGIEELQSNSKKLLMVTDVTGKITPIRNNTLLLFIYEDGTIERKYCLE